MGNLCCAKAGVPPPEPQTDPEDEPPVSMDIPAITDKLLNEKAAEVQSLIDQTNSLATDAQSLKATLDNSRAKAGEVVDKTAQRVQGYTAKRDLGKEGEDWPMHTVEYFRQKRTEIEEWIQVLVKLRYSAVQQHEPALAALEEKTGQVETAQSNVASLLSRARAAGRVPKNLSLKASKIEENIKKLVEALNQVHLAIKAIRDVIAAAMKSMEHLPETLKLLKELICIDPKALEAGDISIEEVATCSDFDLILEEKHSAVDVWEEALSFPAPDIDITTVFDFRDEVKERIRDNLLNKAYEKVKGEKETPFTEGEVYKLINAFFQAKRKADEAATAQPMVIDTFVLNHILFNYSRKPSTAIISFVEGFREAMNAGKPYLRFYASFFGFCTQTPIPQVVTALVPQLDSILEEIVNDGALRRGLSTDVESMSEEEKSQYLVARGFIHLSDAASLIYERLNDWPQQVGRALEQLHPAKVTEEDFFSFLIIHRMKNVDIDAISLFKAIADSAGNLTPQRFVAGLRKELKLWLSPQALKKVFAAMKSEGEKCVHRVDFIRFLRLWGFQKHENALEMVVARTAVLQTLADAYCAVRRDIMLQIYTDFHKNADRADRIRVDQLEPLIRELGENRDLAVLKKANKKDKLTFQEFISLLERFGCEPYNSRFFRNLYTGLTQQKELAEQTAGQVVCYRLQGILFEEIRGLSDVRR